MKKLLSLLSLFSLTNISLANPFEDAIMGNLETIIHEDAIVFLVIALMLFLSSVIYAIKNYKIVLENDELEAKKKVNIVYVIFLALAFAIGITKFKLSVVIWLIAIIIAIESYISTLIKKDMIKTDKIVKRSLVFLFTSLVFLVIGGWGLEIWHTDYGLHGLPPEMWSDGLIAFNRKKSLLYTQFDYLYYAILSSVVILGVLLELTRRKKISNNKLVYIISVISSIVLIIITIVMIVGIINLHK